MNKETQLIEWKSDWKDEYLGWLAGYANALGGTLFIGKENNTGKVIGIDNSEKLLEDLPNKIRDVLGIIVDIDLKTENGLEYIEIKVPAYSHGISYKGEYPYRTGSTRQTLKGASLNKFLLEKSGLDWDSVEMPPVLISELNAQAFSIFKEKAAQTTRFNPDDLNVDNETLLQKLHLISNTHLTRASVLLFHANPEKYIGGAYIKVGSFNEQSELISHDEIHGSIFSQIEETIDILTKKYLKTNLFFDKINRTESLNYPIRALREAIINAIAHKNYQSNNPIQIKVFENKIQIFNEGSLPKDWTMEQFIGNHPSKPANPKIANVLYRVGYIEAWGTGISTILRECHKNGLPLPSFDFDFGGLTVELKQNEVKTKFQSLNRFHILLEHYFENLNKKTITDKNIADFAPLAKKLEDKSLSLIMALQEREMLKRKEVMDLIGLTNQTYNTERYLTPLIDLGLVSQLIKSRPNSSKQRYILTEKGGKFKYLLTKIIAEKN